MPPPHKAQVGYLWSLRIKHLLGLFTQLVFHAGGSCIVVVNLQMWRHGCAGPVVPGLSYKEIWYPLADTKFLDSRGPGTNPHSYLGISYYRIVSNLCCCFQLMIKISYVMRVVLRARLSSFCYPMH